MKKIFILAFSLLQFTFVNNDQNINAIEGNNYYEASVEYYIPTLEDNFENNRILVTLKKDYSDVNKEINVNDFITDNMLLYTHPFIMTKRIIL